MPDTPRTNRICLACARILLAGWVGAATLFVATSIAEQRSGEFDATAKNRLALLRFPLYYAGGFAAVGGGLACVAVAARGIGSRGWWSLGFVAAALAIMLIDYFCIYLPLRETIDPPTAARSSEFVRYHELSKWINFASLASCLIAAVILSTEPSQD